MGNRRIYISVLVLSLLACAGLWWQARRAALLGGDDIGQAILAGSPGIYPRGPLNDRPASPRGQPASRFHRGPAGEAFPAPPPLNPPPAEEEPAPVLPASSQPASCPASAEEEAAPTSEPTTAPAGETHGPIRRAVWNGAASIQLSLEGPIPAGLRSAILWKCDGLVFPEEVGITEEQWAPLGRVRLSRALLLGGCPFTLTGPDGRQERRLMEAPTLFYPMILPGRDGGYVLEVSHLALPAGTDGQRLDLQLPTVLNAAPDGLGAYRLERPRPVWAMLVHSPLERPEGLSLSTLPGAYGALTHLIRQRVVPAGPAADSAAAK